MNDIQRFISEARWRVYLSRNIATHGVPVKKHLPLPDLVKKFKELNPEKPELDLNYFEDHKAEGTGTVKIV